MLPGIFPPVIKNGGTDEKTKLVTFKFKQKMLLKKSPDKSPQKNLGKNVVASRVGEFFWGSYSSVLGMRRARVWEKVKCRADAVATDDAIQLRYNPQLFDRIS